ncbi:MAG: hypothetical protein DWQ19_12855 [Crenarchaeota archaeon]|nr:MAG: hypothetical protein DWQ19_12855 [Thermoproteota archaeon]
MKLSNAIVHVRNLIDSVKKQAPPFVFFPTTGNEEITALNTLFDFAAPFALHQVLGDCPTNDDHEIVLKLQNGWSLVSGVYNPKPGEFTCGEYVRLVDENGEELVYWDQEEWASDPVLVMGTIINAAANPEQTRQALERTKV